MNVAGSVIGLAGVIAALKVLGENHTGVVVGYGFLVAVLVVTTTITLVAINEPPAPAVQRQSIAMSPLA